MNKKLIILIITTLLNLGLISGCIEQNIEVSDKLQILLFQITPTFIDEGDTANLSWSVAGAEVVTIDNDIGDVSLVGYRIVTPTSNTIYTIMASNSTSTKTATTQIIVRNVSDIPEGETAAVTAEIISSNKIRLILAKGGQNYDNGYPASNVSIFINGDEVSLSETWEVGEPILIGKKDGNFAVDGTDALSSGTYSVTVSILDTVVYSGELDVTSQSTTSSSTAAQEDASVTAEVTSDDYIKLILAKGGQNYDDGYDASDVKIYVNGSEVDFSGNWEVGEPILIGKEDGNFAVDGTDALSSGTYSVTVSILDTVVYSGELDVTSTIEPENASVTAEITTNDLIKLILAKGGQNYDSENGYNASKIKIYVSGVGVTGITNWKTGQQFLIGYNATETGFELGGTALDADTYSVNVSIYDTVVYDGDLEVN